MRSKRKKDDFEVKLTGGLAEFRTALQKEIEAARTNIASSATPLSNGRRLYFSGNYYIYEFNIDSALFLPGDIPGDLKIGNKEPLEVVIIKIEGLKICLGISEDVGEFIPVARLQSDLTFLLKKLIERIEGLHNKANDVGDRLLNERVSGETEEIQLHDLNEEQNHAVGSSLGRNMTFIWGPPGTGKTRVIGAIGDQLLRRKRSTLLVSHTNIAVDQALNRIGELAIKDSDLSKELENGKILRVGEPSNIHLYDSFPNLLLKTHVDRKSDELVSKRNSFQIKIDAIVIDIEDLSKNIELCEWIYEAKVDIETMKTNHQAIKDTYTKLKLQEKEIAEKQKDLKYWSAASVKAELTREKILEKEKTTKVIKEVQQQISEERKILNEIGINVNEANTLYAETNSVGWLTRNWRRLPAPEKQKEVVENLEQEFQSEKDKFGKAINELEKLKSSHKKLSNTISIFLETYHKSPSDVIQECIKLKNYLYKIETENATSYRKRNREHQELTQMLHSRLQILSKRKLTNITDGTLEEMLNAVCEAYSKTKNLVQAYDLNNLKEQLTLKNRLKNQFVYNIKHIEEQLKRVEEEFIENATIIATTLTRAYLRDVIQSRRFDTIILDEASMAPIPALWVAASLADTNVVVVGDYKQLPPIVLSNHEIALKWLGEDIFLKNKADEKKLPYMVTLLEQFRMHPGISIIPNCLFYENKLRNNICTRNDDQLLNWYDANWGFDAPVLLVDTGATNAWVTSVVRGPGKNSRLNYLSATICINIAERMFKHPVHETEFENRTRKILIVNPYRPHAKLLQLLIQDQNLTGFVDAGTAHSFQGSEADIVIFDLVNDEPHWRVGLFIPSADQNTKRLMNVALTRSRRRLVIVGDFDYIYKHAKKAFLGELITLLKSGYKTVDALDVVSNSIFAESFKATQTVFGGAIELGADRVVVNQDNFYKILLNDIYNAKNRIVIYSPFITQDRLGKVNVPIRAAIEKGTSVFVVTKDIEDRNKREKDNYKFLERTLESWGITVIHKRRMHEKLVFIDNDILWSGSLNPLSFSDTQEVMERRKSEKVCLDYSNTLRLAELIGEYHSGKPKCPICGSEIIASEGADDPFYWRCVQPDCYTRSIGDEPIKDGKLKCSNCNAELEYGEWGNKSVWRCLENRRHHQRIARTHLLLPKMRVKIPQKELRKLESIYGISRNS